MISLWGASSGSKPNLVLDFIGSETLDPRVTFSRASNATRTNAQGLIAYAPHNLELYSQTFANAFWDKAGGLVTVTDNFTTAPDGTTTAAKWTEAAGTGSHHIHDAAGNFTPVVGQAYTMSMYLKQTETNPDRYVQMVFWLAGFPATAYANFDMQTGAIAFRGAGLTSATITPENNGWYRLSISAVATATGASGWQAAFISNATAARAESYTVSAGNEESYYLWGAQVNLGGLVGYTLTTSAVAYGPRFDFDPVTLAPKGLLIEEARTNLLTYSEQFDNAAWNNWQSSYVANATTAPDGTLTADKLVENTTNNTHAGSYNIALSFTAGVAYTASLFIKAAGKTVASLKLPSSAFTSSVYGADFNLTTGIATPKVGTNVVASMDSVGGGWFRCSITGVATATASGSPVTIFPSSIEQGYTGDGTSGIYIWGAQLEAGAFPTSYIPTVASQATRAADNAVMTGTNFSSWYRQDEGTVLCNFMPKASASNRTIWDLNNQTGSEYIELRYSSGSALQYDSADNGIEQWSIAPTGYSSLNTRYLHAATYKANDIASSVNGSSILSDSSASLASPTQLNLGVSYNSVSENLNGYIAKLAYYPKRLTNAELQSITTV